MKKSDSKENGDILDEPYKGPGAIAAAAGYVSLYHWVAMVVGFVGFGALGMLAAKPTNAIKEAFTEFSVANKSNNNWLKKAPAHMAGWVTRSADYIAHKVVGLGKNVVRGGVQTKPMSEQKLSAFMFAGGVGGAAGWIGSSVWGVIQGGHEGNSGKRQFNRAKAEIKELRERNQDLEKINEALEKKHGDARTEKHEPHVSPTTDSDAALNEVPAHHIALDGTHETEHHGKVHAHAPHAQAEHHHA
jgi:hypothetical protein